MTVPTQASHLLAASIPMTKRMRPAWHTEASLPGCPLKALNLEH